MKIEKDRVVSLHYHLTDDDGDVIDSSRDSTPLGYLHGHGNLVAGVETALLGKGAGDKLDVVVPPEEGYGTHDPELDLAPALLYSMYFGVFQLIFLNWPLQRQQTAAKPVPWGRGLIHELRPPHLQM